jgi:hypothetical protein
MANSNARLRKALKKVSQPQTGWLDVFPAVIGKEDGTVDTGTPGEIFVRNVLNGQTLTVHNGTAPAIATLQVEVGRRVEQPGLWQIKGVRESFSVPAGRNNVPYHADQHTFPAADTVWVDRKQILALTVLVSDAANTLVKVFGATVRTATGVAVIDSQEIDLSSYIPATGAIYISIESDDAGALTVHAGAGFAAPELATSADVPVPASGKYMLAYVLLTEGMLELSNDNIRVPTILSSGGGGGHTIQDEGTPLTARANLNFVGSGVAATDDAGNNATVVTISAGGAAVADIGSTAETVGGSVDNGTAITASRSDHKHAITNPKLDDLATPDDNTDLNANTTNHGLLLKATAPAANELNVVGIANGETVYANKDLFNTTAPADLANTASSGTAIQASRSDHVHKAPDEYARTFMLMGA